MGRVPGVGLVCLHSGSHIRAEKEGVKTKNSELMFCSRLLSSGCPGPGGLKQQVYLILLKFLVVILLLTILVVVSLPACSRGGRFFQRRLTSCRSGPGALKQQNHVFLLIFVKFLVGVFSCSPSSRGAVLAALLIWLI